MSIALTASQPALKTCQSCPCSELRQFGAGHDVRAAALPAFDRQLQPEADKITGRADVFRGHFARLTHEERNRNMVGCGLWGRQKSRLEKQDDGARYHKKGEYRGDDNVGLLQGFQNLTKIRHTRDVHKKVRPGPRLRARPLRPEVKV